jgi:integrase
MLTSLGFPNAATGEKHTPHDCRHTFSWMADKAKMDDLSKHLIMGHSLGKDVEKNTYGHRTLEELRAEMEKIKRV